MYEELSSLSWNPERIFAKSEWLQMFFTLIHRVRVKDPLNSKIYFTGFDLEIWKSTLTWFVLEDVCEFQEILKLHTRWAEF